MFICKIFMVFRKTALGLCLLRSLLIFSEVRLCTGAAAPHPHPLSYSLHLTAVVKITNWKFSIKFRLKQLILLIICRYGQFNFYHVV